MEFISLAAINDVLATLTPKDRVSQHKGPLTLADLAKMTDRQRRNLGNLVARRLAKTPETKGND